MSRVLAKVGLKLASSPRRALLSLIVRRVRLKLRGLKYVERTEAEVSREDLTRIDTCWVVAEGLALVDFIQGTTFQTLHLILALNAGEPVRVARALAFEAGYTAASGSPEEVRRLLEQAEELARRVNAKTVIGLCRMVGAVAALHSGRWKEGIELAKEAESILRSLADETWTLSITRVYYVSSLVEAGEIGEACRSSMEMLHDALRLGYRRGFRLSRWREQSEANRCVSDIHG